MAVSTIGTSLTTIPIYVFTGKNFVNSLVGRHNIAESDSVVARDGGTKIFGFASGGNVTGGCKYSKPSVGFERNKFIIPTPQKIVENPLKGKAMSKVGAGGVSAIPTDGLKKLLLAPVVGTDIYLVGETVNGFPGAGLHKPGWGAENEANAIEFDLGTTQYVGSILLYFYTPVATTARFVYYKVKTSLNGSTYTYVSGRAAASTEGDYGWSKSAGFPEPPEALENELRATVVTINATCRYIKVYTDGSSDKNPVATYDAAQTLIDKKAYLYEIEISNAAGYRYLQTNFICFKRFDDGITDISGAALSSSVDLIFKDVGDGAFVKITNNLAYDIFIYSFELYGLWILKASEADNINGSIRSVVVSPGNADLFTENAISVRNDKIQYPEYADRLATSLLNSNARETAEIRVGKMPLDLLLNTLHKVNVNVSELSTDPIKSIVREKSYQLSSTVCAISLKLAEDSSL